MVRAILAITAIALLGAIACAPDVGAETPPELPGTPDSSDIGQPPEVFPTSTPWPRFGPPPVTADLITATVQAGPNAPGDSPNTQVTPTAAPNVTPDAGGGPIANAIGSPVPDATATPLDSSGTFAPLLPYSYPVPLDWEETIGDDEIVIAHSSGQARVTVRERTVNRSSIESIIEVAQFHQPLEFVDWRERSLFDVRVTGDNSLRQEFAGTKLGDPHIAVVDWYLWGELLVEVVTEAEAGTWAVNSDLHNTALLIASSFAPDTQLPLASLVEIENQLLATFSQRPSNIFTNPSNGSEPYQLSCRELQLDLLSDPVYLGSGEWQVFAVTQQGAQVWQIFEPSLNIVPALHNTSTC